MSIIPPIPGEREMIAEYASDVNQTHPMAMVRTSTLAQSVAILRMIAKEIPQESKRIDAIMTHKEELEDIANWMAKMPDRVYYLHRIMERTWEDEGWGNGRVMREIDR